jgi:hypothetical protein
MAALRHFPCLLLVLLITNSSSAVEFMNFGFIAEPIENYCFSEWVDKEVPVTVDIICKNPKHVLILTIRGPDGNELSESDEKSTIKKTFYTEEKGTF